MKTSETTGRVGTRGIGISTFRTRRRRRSAAQVRPSALVLGLLVIFWSILSLGACLPGHYRPKPNEELYGTWTNGKYGTLYFGNVSPQKIVFDQVGYWYYTRLRDESLSVMGQEVIDAKWTDPKGNIYYKTFGSVLSYKFQRLYRLSKSAALLEYVTQWLDEFDSDRYPPDIDAANPEYRIYYPEGLKP